VKRLLLTFDVEEFDLPVERGCALDAAAQMDVTSHGLDLVLPLLAKHRTRATFFVTATYARARPQQLRAVAGAGHEVASHGLGHQDDYGHMRETEAHSRLAAARRAVEEAAGGPVYGIRTPHLLPCPAAPLLAAGFSYDASAHPTWVPGRYNGLRWPRVPWLEDGLLRIPISVLPAIRMPVSFLWYRAAGPRLGPLAARLAAAGSPYLHLYFHPWEAMDIRPFGVPSWLAVRTGPPFLAALDRLLSRCGPRFRAATLAELAGEMNETTRSGLSRC
jgi:peptidoglycan/xylan/chitin deacetylase (PgdA/CDA1 family)